MNNIRLTPVVKNLLIVNVAVYLLVYGGAMFGLFNGIPIGQYISLFKVDILDIIPGEQKYFLPVQLVTYFFNHGGITHILFNMMALAFLGPLVEMVMGSKRFLTFYLFCGVVAGILLALFDPSPVPVVGASGAILGVLAAFAFYFPKERLSILFLPFSFKSRDFAWGIAAISAVFVMVSYLEVFGIIPPSESSGGYGGGISHFGHLAGMVSAVLYGYVERLFPNGENR